MHAAGLYSLIFGNKKKPNIKQLVCFEVRPPIRKAGAYMTKETAEDEFGLIDTRRMFAINKK